MMKNSNFEELKKNLKNKIGDEDIINNAPDLPKWKLVEIIKYFSAIRKERFVRKKSLLGDMERALPEEIYKKLLKNIKNHKVKLAVKLQGNLALRISEVVILQKDHFDFINHVVRVWEPKNRTYRHVPLSPMIERELKKYLKQFEKKIGCSEGYIFFSENVSENRSHLSCNWLRNEIERYITKTGMQRIYAIDASGKQRHLYTSHSLRGYGIMKFYNNCQDILLTQKFAGHDEIGSTMHYVTHDFQKIMEVVRNY